MKRKTKRIEAVCIYIIMLLLLLLLPQTAMAKNTEKSKTTFPIQVIHRTGDERAKALRTELEENYLDEGATPLIRKKSNGVNCWDFVGSESRPPERIPHLHQAANV